MGVIFCFPLVLRLIYYFIGGAGKTKRPRFVLLIVLFFPTYFRCRSYPPTPLLPPQPPPHRRTQGFFKSQGHAHAYTYTCARAPPSLPSMSILSHALHFHSSPFTTAFWLAGGWGSEKVKRGRARLMKADLCASIGFLRTGRREGRGEEGREGRQRE